MIEERRAEREIQHHGLKGHLKMSKAAKFAFELLQHVKDITVISRQILFIRIYTCITHESNCYFGLKNGYFYRVLRGCTKNLRAFQNNILHIYFS